MMLILLFSLFLMTNNLVSQAIMLPPPQQHINTIFVFYKFTTQWPRSFCNRNPGKCSPSLPRLNTFTIHGLWPSDQNGITVDYHYGTCITSALPIFGNITNQHLLPIKKDLDKYWPDFKRRATKRGNIIFWNEQWMKHGRCSAYPSIPLDYFQLTLCLHQLYDPTNILKNAGILPGTHTTVGLVRRTMFNAINAYVEIRCNYNENAPRNWRNQLWEISICVNPQNDLQNCTTRVSGSCRSLADSIVLP